jgi:hypothetical protein
MHEYGRPNPSREQEAADAKVEALADWGHIEKPALNGKIDESFTMTTEKSQDPAHQLTHLVTLCRSIGVILDFALDDPLM